MGSGGKVKVHPDVHPNLASQHREGLHTQLTLSLTVLCLVGECLGGPFVVKQCVKSNSVVL